MYYGCACTLLEIYMLILMLWYIIMNVIIHGADYKALKYKHERDYAWGWNEMLKAEYGWGHCVKIIKISLGEFN